MKSKYSELKKTVDIFRKHGIFNIAKNKNRDLYLDYGLSEYYVNYILYDVEEKLSINLGENNLKELNQPLDIISLVLSALKREGLN